MVKRSSTKQNSPKLTWPDNTELLGLAFELTPNSNATVLPQYTTGLHAWFLSQVQQHDPTLSAYLHDGQSEKAFTVSRLDGNIETAGKRLQLLSTETYHWYVTGLSASVVNWMANWVQHLPPKIDLRDVDLAIKSVRILHSPTTYQQLSQTPIQKTLTLSFISPTSFRHKGHHFPLPLPQNVFHSYLRRWNDFSGIPFEQDTFLDWIDQNVIIVRHQLESLKVAAGKRGSVTGFTGAIEYSLTRNGQNNPEFVQLFNSLGELAPYCGTGHKTTFGLGQTRLGWLEKYPKIETFNLDNLLAQRIEQLTEQLMQTQKRQGGNRGLTVSQTRAIILARQEFGESLIDIARDISMPYETVKTYAKLARRNLKNLEK